MVQSRRSSAIALALRTDLTNRTYQDEELLGQRPPRRHRNRLQLLIPFAVRSHRSRIFIKATRGRAALRIQHPRIGVHLIEALAGGLTCLRGREVPHHRVHHKILRGLLSHLTSWYVMSHEEEPAHKCKRYRFGLS